MQKSVKCVRTLNRPAFSSSLKNVLLAGIFANCGAKTELKGAMRDASADRVNAQMGPDVQFDVFAPDTGCGQCAPFASRSWLCANGVASRLVNPCDSLAIGTIRMTYAGPELDGGTRDNSVIISTNSCSISTTQPLISDQVLGVLRFDPDEHYDFVLTSPSPENGAFGDMFLQAWVASCGIPIAHDPPSECNGVKYQTLVVPLLKGQEFRISAFSFRNLEINEAVGAPTDGGPCPISNITVRLSIGLRNGAYRADVILREGQSAGWRRTDAGCFFIAASSIRMTVGAPIVPRPGAPGTCSITEEWSVVTVRVPMI